MGLNELLIPPMKRDMNLIRAMLLHYEGDGPDLSPWTEAERMFHAELLVEAEFLKGTVKRDYLLEHRNEE